MKLQIAKWGNSAAVRLPRSLMDQLGLAPGGEVNVIVENRTARLIPVRSHSRYDAIIEAMVRLGPDGEPDDIDWGVDRASETLEDEAGRAENGRGAAHTAEPR